jgi:biopolymer transport protein ExbD
MPRIIEGEWNIIDIIMGILTVIFLLLVFFGVVFPFLMQHIECDFPCGCHIESKPYDSDRGNIVRHLYAENGYLYAELCNGNTMQVDNFQNDLPI